MMTSLAVKVMVLAPTDVRQPTAQQPPGTGGLLHILGWALWAVMACCLIGVLIGAGRLALQNNRGEEMHGVKGVVFALIAAVVAGGAAGLINAVS